MQMADSNNRQAGSMLSNTFGLAKKLGTTGLNILSHVAPSSVTKLNQTPEKDSIIEGKSHSQNMFEKKQYENPQQLMREHLPKVSSQLLGQHYKKINNVASFLSPQLNDKISDYFFNKLNDFVSEGSSVDKLLKEVGVKNLKDLSQDSARSQRISQALANQNKVLAVLQGAFTGATGVVGSAIDVPTSIALALRSIYQTGRAHGFELKPEDHDIVEFIFKKIDIGTVAEKQALLIAVRTFATTLQSHDISQFQQLVGSSTSSDLLKNWLNNEDGTLKWPWLDNLPQLNIVSKLTPLACVGISATYSWKLVDDATAKAQLVFKGAQQYVIQHPNDNISALAAFEKSEILLAQASLLLQASNHEDAAPTAASQESVENDIIQDVQVLPKDEAQALKNTEETSITDLAKEHVVMENPIATDETVINKAEKTEKLTEKLPIDEKNATKDALINDTEVETEKELDQATEKAAVTQNVEATTKSKGNKKNLK